ATTPPPSAPPTAEVDPPLLRTHDRYHRPEDLPRQRLRLRQRREPAEQLMQIRHVIELFRELPAIGVELPLDLLAMADIPEHAAQSDRHAQPVTDDAARL